MISTPTVNPAKARRDPKRQSMEHAEISAPIRADNEPRPPNRLVPPITTAVIDEVRRRLRTDPTDPADQHPGGNRADQPGQRIDRDQGAVGADAGEAGGAGSSPVA